MSELLREDEANRRRALEPASFIVEAPAGAGKTELLTQRYLRLLATVDEPEEIVAITFTNKTAGEMRERIADSLALARDPAEPARAHKRVTRVLAQAALQRAVERGWDIERQPGRLRLITIDALCAGLARQMPLLSRFGAQPAMVEDAARHYREAARRAIEHLEDGAGDEQAEAVAVALEWVDNDAERLAGLLAAMLARREQWHGLAALDDPGEALDAALNELLREELGFALGTLDTNWQQGWMGLARFAADQLGPDSVPAAIWPANAADREQARSYIGCLRPEVVDLPRWRALADFLLTREGTPRKTVNKNNGFPSEKELKPQKDAMLAALQGITEAQAEALRRVRALPATDGSGDGVVRAFARLMKLAAAELWLVFREAGEIDFAELAARAIAALGDEEDPTELGLRLDWRIRHLLVDEFQDTSPTQVELLQRLTAGWQDGDGRTLFLVGDPMQSIYRFRKAEVGLFLRVQRFGLGGLPLESLRLSRNNRACAPVVDWINDRFPALFPAADEPLRGEIRYRPFVATREPLPDAGVSVHPLLAARGEHEAEAELVARIVTDERAADAQREIAVLVRARDHLAAIVCALRSRGLRFSAVEIEPLAGRQAVQDLLSLTRALHHRADRLHWLAVLRAPWCGLTLADLHALAGDDHDATIWSLATDADRIGRLTPDGQRRLAHVVAVLGEALGGQGRHSRRRWVEDAWKKLGGPACLADAGELADAESYFRRIEALDAAGRFTLDTLEEDMARLFAGPDPQADGRLQLMTIHKAKGLEFDTVILPGLHRPPRGQDSPLLAWDSFPLEQGECLLAAPINRRRREDGLPTLHDFLRAMEAERNRNEEARLLYVAATRAVRRLHILAVAEPDAAGVARAPKEGTLLARLWPAVGTGFGGIAVASAPTLEPAAATASVPLRRLAAPGVPTAWQAPAQVPAETADAGTHDPLAAAVGTLVHAVLELAAAEPAAWAPGSLAARHAGFARWLATRGWGPAEAEQGARRSAAMLATALGSADGQWLLRPRADAGAEVALARPLESGGIETRVVDRSFVEDGVRWIIDYKTTDLGPDAGPPRLAAEAARHRGQLDAYAALYAAEGRPCRCAVFFVAHGRLVGLE
jgi:ATP-dependent exoDNAse (exonuclease V) beta subunit